MDKRGDGDGERRGGVKQQDELLVDFASRSRANSSLKLEDELDEDDY